MTTTEAPAQTVDSLAGCAVILGGRIVNVFTVDDNGSGVPREERQRIFTPFYTTKDTGTGLGLAIAHTVVSLHGGSLTVDDAPTGGARFRMMVPL